MQERDIEQLLRQTDFTRPGAQERVWQHVLDGLTQEEGIELSDDVLEMLAAAGEGIVNPTFDPVGRR
jgi:hypothetical protein